MMQAHVLGCHLVAADECQPGEQVRMAGAAPAGERRWLTRRWSFGANPPPDLLRLAERYLAFLVEAQAPDGAFRNRLGPDRRWRDEPGVGDWWGRAMTVSADPRWERGLASAIDWFLGANDNGLPLHDPSTGGGCDGLTASGRNENQGAESTLALLSALQQAQRLDSADDPVLAGPRSGLSRRLSSCPAFDD